MLVIHTGAIAGRVLQVRDHPDGDKIWLARVDLGDGGWPVQIVFGGAYRVRPGEVVPVAPPGLRSVALDSDARVRKAKKMRKRSYRGQPSHGMFCSLDELGWYRGGPDEVAILRNLKPGTPLDTIPSCERANYVVRPRCFLELATADTGKMQPITAGRGDASELSAVR